VRRVGALVVVAALALAAGACGGGNHALSKDASTLLQAQVRSARDAAAQGDAVTALQRLDVARQQLDRLEQAGEVSSSRATEIASAIDATKTAVQTNITAPTTSTTSPPETEASTTTTTIEATTTTESSSTTNTSTTKPDKGKGKGDGKGDGGGHGGGD
jgi:hypothetical protein